MKKVLLIAIPAALIGWLLWRGFGGAGPEDETAATEVPVHVGEILRTTLRGYVTAYGTVEPEPAGERAAAGTRLSPSVAGVVVAVNVMEGQQVSKGSVLFELDSRSADVAVTFARKALERERQLMQSGGTSAKRLQEAEQQLDDALVQRALLRITAPLAGTVTRVNVKPGEAVELNSAMAEIVDLDRLVVSAGVPASEVVLLEPGRVAEVVTDTTSSPVEGTLVFIGGGVDTATGTVPLRVSLPAGSGLRPGQFVSVRVVSAEHADCLAVPLESIASDEDGATVIAVVNNGVAVQHAVSTGLRDIGLVEVVADGLQPGMTVVTEGAYALPKETRVRVLQD
jgi:membrane fusion protein, multidrug efflux system